MILLCGGSGFLGGLIARHLVAAGASVRALARATTDASTLERQGIEVVRGDLRDSASLLPALAGVETVVTTANAIGRALAGEKSLTIHDVDELGNASLVDAAETAGVRRFVFISAGDPRTATVRTPYTDAKLATERRLAASAMDVVIVRPDAFQEVWLSPVGGFDPVGCSIRVYGEGRSRIHFVAMDDVAAAVARVALMAAPPGELVLGGPEALSMMDVAKRYGELTEPVKVSHVPRIALRVGVRLLRAIRPPMASMMGMALGNDLADSTLDDAGFRLLGIVPRPASSYLEGLAASRS